MAKLYEVIRPIPEQTVDCLQQAAALRDLQAFKNKSLTGHAIDRQVNTVASRQGRFERFGHSAVGQPTNKVMDAGEEQMRVDDAVLGHLNPTTPQSGLEENSELKFGEIHWPVISPSALS